MPPLVRLSNVSLNYRLYHQRSRSLKGTVIGKLKRQDGVDYFPALRCIDLTIGAGESVAVLGPNGSGKSTLLKIVAGVFAPSAGQVESKGKVTAMLELGAGFSPDLTGWENISLNAALLGQSPDFAEKHRKQIIDFSELAHFIDAPLRHYSTGMHMRLGFAVAIHAQADLLIFDEVMAVGDAGFQAKCIQAIADQKTQGTGLMIVTHTPESLKGICERAILLHRGTIAFDGSLEEATARYRNMF